ncbi:MAG: protein kinase domain-containing protein [Calditrichota bacterium]
MPDSALFASRYRILRTLGSGGMGVVYLVEDTRRDNKVMALKTMKQDGNDEAEASFRSEFQSIRGVVHPNIPEVYDFGQAPEQDNQLFFSSEFVDGRPLDTLVEKWDITQLQVILVSLCRALSFFHSRGFYHRDVKPDNVLAKLDENGSIQTLKLVDFGLAAKRGTGSSTVGTIAYLAPELITGADASVASDIYAMGMLMYRLATGRMPFTGDDPLAVAKQRCIHEAPPALRYNPDLPVGLSDVIGAMLLIKPEDRPPSARHVIALLNEHQGTEFPYETAETRQAYIRSAISVTHRDARAEMEIRIQSLLAGETPPPLVIEGNKGLGRKRLLHDFADDLSLKNIAVRRVVDGTEICNYDPCRVLVVPHVENVIAERFVDLLHAAHRKQMWLVIGTAELTDALRGQLGEFDQLTLRPMPAPQVAEFVAATFPDSAFENAFAVRLHSETMGLAIGVQSILDHLLAAEQLRIGLTGWELLPGRWEVPLHPGVAEYISYSLSKLGTVAWQIVSTLACSAHPLPREIFNSVWKDEWTDPAVLDAAMVQLEPLRWFDQTESGYVSRFTALSDYFEYMHDTSEHQELHRRLKDAWTAYQCDDCPWRDRERLYHDIHARDWLISAEQCAKIFLTALEDGQITWARRLAEVGLQSDPPREHWSVLLDMLTMIENMEGNVEASASRLGELLSEGNLEVTAENIERFARYAALEEKLGRADHAQEILERCLTALPAGHDSRAGLVYGTLAWITFKRGEADTARTLAEEGLVRTPPKAVDTGYALLLNTVATLAFYRGEMDAAELYWSRCLEVYEEIHDRQGIANIYNSLGVLAAQTGDRLRARSLWQQCGEIAREINDVHRLAGIYNNLGIDALENGSLPEAEDYYTKALGLFRRLKNPRAQVEILSNLGELAFYRADYPRAQAYLQEAVQIASQLDDREGEIEPLIHLGRVLFTLDELETAVAMFERACNTARDVEAKKGEGQAWEQMALVQARRGRWKSAREALERARSLLSEDLDPLAQVHLHLSESLIAALNEDQETIRTALEAAKRVAETKWDPYASARATVYGLLFAQDRIDHRERSRILRQLAVYPDFLWRFHWASARRFTEEGAVRNALDEFGRGAAVLKAIASRLSEEGRNRYLGSPQIKQFRDEAIAVKKSVKQG